MPLMDEFREEREALKNGTPKQKLEYFWDYYKWHTIGIIVGVICVVSLVHTFLSAKDAALNVAMLNCTELYPAAEEMQQAFAEYAGIDLNELELRFDTDCHISMNAYDQHTVNTLQKLMVSIAAGDTDAIMGCGDVFTHYAHSGFLSDLRDILSEEQITAYEPHFYYIDMTVVEELEQASAESLDISSIKIPDPRKPEDMSAPVPVAIFVDSDKLIQYYYFPDASDDLAIGVIANTARQDTTIAFIDYILQLP